MHIFHSRENIKTCIFTAVKIQDLIFSRDKNRKIGTTFFSMWSKGSLKVEESVTLNVLGNLANGEL